MEELQKRYDRFNRMTYAERRHEVIVLEMMLRDLQELQDVSPMAYRPRVMKSIRQDLKMIHSITADRLQSCG